MGSMDFHLVRTKMGFLAALGVTLFLFGMFCWPVANQSPWIIVFWAMLGTLVSYFSLNGLQYFEAFTPLPSSANLFTLLLVLPWGPFAAKIFLATLLDEKIVRTGTIFLSAQVASFLAYLYQYISGWLFIRRNQTRRLWTILSANDKQLLQKELQELGIGKYFEWIQSGSEKPDLIVISHSQVKDFTKHPDLIYAYLNAVPIIDLPIFRTNLHGKVSIDTIDLWTYMQHASKQYGVSKTYFKLKCLLEPILALALLILLAPLLLGIAILVKASSPGPVLYRQIRTGYRGKNFTLYKFRSMKVAPDDSPAVWANSPTEILRLTSIGAFLRHSHLDELPQLFNIIAGHLSFVGPRPERPELYAKIQAEVPAFHLRVLVRPGVTGWAQVMAGYAGSIEESKKKLEHDLYYMQHMAPSIDLKVMIKTLFNLCWFRNANAH